MKIPDDLFKNIPVKYAAIAVLPLFALLWIPIVNFTVLYAGESVLLETMPIDPTDFLRGDYVILDYKISDVPDDLIPPDIDMEKGYRRNFDNREVIYATLDKDTGGVGHLKGVSATRPDGGLYLKGSFNSRWSYYSMNLRYDGIEAYYVPEGTGREIERKINDSTVLVDVRVLRGHAAINGLVFMEKDDE